MKFLPIADYSDYRLYLYDCFEQNKKNGKIISIRWLSKRLCWSSSYLSEVMAGKRNLTFARALKLANYAKFSNVDTEKLIYLILMNSENDDVKNYFSNKVNTYFNTDKSSDLTKRFAGLKNDLNQDFQDIYDDFPCIVLFGFLKWFPQNIEKEKIPHYLYSMPEFKNIDFLNEKLNKLENMGLIKILNNTSSEILSVKILKKELFFFWEKIGVPNGVSFSLNMARMLRDRRASGVFNSGFILLNKNDFNEAVDRISMLRNWLLKVDQNSALHCSTENILFQYDLNLISAIAIKDYTGVNINTWANANM